MPKKLIELLNKLDNLPQQVPKKAYNCFRFDGNNKIQWQDIQQYKNNDWVGSTVINAFFALISDEHSRNDWDIVKTSDFGDQWICPKENSELDTLTACREVYTAIMVSINGKKLFMPSTLRPARTSTIWEG